MTIVKYKIKNYETSSLKEAKAIAKEMGAEMRTVFTTVPDNYFINRTARETIPQTLKRLGKYPCIWKEV